jgi:hypothetical protein
MTPDKPINVIHGPLLSLSFQFSGVLAIDTASIAGLRTPPLGAV